MVGAFLVGLPFGANGVAIAYSASSLLAILPVTFFFGGRAGPVATRDLWFRALSHVPIFVAVLAATWLARISIARAWSPLSQLSVWGAIGIIAGFAALLTFTKSRRVMTTLVTLLGELKDHRPEERQIEATT
jgi:PST family polysaccharide transporter